MGEPSYPWTSPDQFDGLIQHAERFLGPVRYALPAEFDGRNRGFAVGIHDHDEFDMVSACTTGVRFHKVSVSCPQEFVCSALPGQEEEAAYLVHVVADRVVRAGKGYEYETGYVNAEPLIPESQIEFLLAAPHPYVDDEFDLFRDNTGKAVLQFMTLLPATRSEFDFVRDHSVAELLDLWGSAETELLDLYRSSAV